MLAAKSSVKSGKERMSRIGKKAITLPTGVTITPGATEIVVKGSKGELKVVNFPGITVEVVEGKVQVGRTNEERQTRAYHGLVRSLIENAVEGVNTGYKITLKLVGTGYRVAAKGQGLTLSLGFSHPVEFAAVQGVKFTVEGNDTIHLDSIDKQLVGQVAANIRKIRPPEPYKGKGVRYADEVVRRKAGKTATK
jgi:large subunit ribosomal protein L6